jgi:ribonuclease Z
MLTELHAGPYSIRGVSVGGVYTSLQVRELGVVLDAGLPIRSFAGTDRLFLSHGHPDHAGALGALLGIRRLLGKGAPQVFLPAELAAPLQESLALQSRVHHCDLSIHAVPLLPGDTHELGQGLWVRALRTHHPVASLGYQFLRRVTKLREPYRSLPGEEIARLRRENAPGVFEHVERLELAYVTDTLSRVLETSPSLLHSRVLILECTFVDAQRSIEDAQARAHLHLDELVSRAELFQNEALVLMHFSQSLAPAEVHAQVRSRLPPSLQQRVHVFAPTAGPWFG